MTTPYDVIVVGAGAVGSAAARAAARSGQRVLLLEQYAIDHQHGSSYGASRIIRYVYDHTVYIELAKRAFPMWAEIEAESGATIFTRTGGIDFAPGESADLRAIRLALGESGIAYEMLTTDEVRYRYPQVNVPDGVDVLYQSESGVVRASLAVRTVVELARKAGVTIHDNTRVTGIVLRADGADVTTTQGAFSAARLIVAPGAWGKALFASVGVELPLQPVKCQENYFHAEPAGDFEAGHFPVFIAHMFDAYGYKPYGLPSVDGSGLKVGLHGGPPFDVDAPDRTPSADVIATAREFMGRHIPAGADAPHAMSRVCLYTMTPDEHFILDTHPEHAHVVLASCCSGHGFKFMPVLGDLANRLALGETEAIPLFRMSRFATASGD